MQGVQIKMRLNFRIHLELQLFLSNWEFPLSSGRTKDYDRRCNESFIKFYRLLGLQHLLLNDF